MFFENTFVLQTTQMKYNTLRYHVEIVIQSKNDAFAIAVSTVVFIYVPFLISFF